MGRRPRSLTGMMGSGGSGKGLGGLSLPKQSIGPKPLPKGPTHQGPDFGYAGASPTMPARLAALSATTDGIGPPKQPKARPTLGKMPTNRKSKSYLGP